MENCLVTKLKESVANDNLIALGYTKIHFDNSHANGDFYLSVIEAGTFARIFNSSATFSNGSKTIEFDSSHFDTAALGVTVGGGIMDMEIPAYKLSGLRFVPVYGSGDGFEFDLSCLKYSDRMVMLDVPYNKIYGNIANLSNCNCRTLNLYSTNVAGSIEDFIPSAVRAMQDINQRDDIAFLDYSFGRTALTGSLKNLLDSVAAVANSGKYMKLNMLRADAIDYTGTTITPEQNNVIVDFDGNGGWSVRA
jgi:hypothetical protein